jgi:hypothetical protein
MDLLVHLKGKELETYRHVGLAEVPLSMVWRGLGVKRYLYYLGIKKSLQYFLNKYMISEVNTSMHVTSEPTNSLGLCALYNRRLYLSHLMALKYAYFQVK